MTWYERRLAAVGCTHLDVLPPYDGTAGWVEMLAAHVFLHHAETGHVEVSPVDVARLGVPSDDPPFLYDPIFVGGLQQQGYDVGDVRRMIREARTDRKPGS